MRALQMRYILHFRIRFALAVFLYSFGLLAAISESTSNVKGTFSLTRIVGRQLISLSDWFSVTVNETNYVIRIGGLGSSNCLYTEFGRMVNGGCYVLTQFDTNTLVSEYKELNGKEFISRKLAKPVRPTNDAILWLNKGMSPMEQGVGVFEAIRLAYVQYPKYKGHANLTTVGPQQVPPIFSTRDSLTEKGGLANAMIILSESPPYLLESMIQWLDADSYLSVKLVPPFATAYTNATYRVSNWTNVGGLLIPQHFEVERRSPTNDNRIIYLVNANLVTVGTNVIPALGVPDNTRVIERRFGDGLIPEHFDYLTTNGLLWTKAGILKNTNLLINITTNQAFLRNILENAAVAQPRSHFFGRALFLLIFAVPAASLIWWLVRQSPKHKNEN